MKTTRFFMLTLFVLSTLFLPNTFAQEIPAAPDFLHTVLDNGDRGYCRSTAFSPDGTILAAGAHGDWGAGFIHLWDVEASQLLDTLDLGGKITTYSLAFSPDGQILASASDDNTIRIWDIVTGQLLDTLHEVSAYRVADLVFSPDGTLLASKGGVRGQEVILWDVATRTQRYTLQGGGGAKMAFSPDGNTLASGEINGIRLWEVATGELQFTLKHGGWPGVAFSPDGATLAGVSSSSTAGGVDGIYLWDVATGKHLSTIEEPKDINFTRDVTFSPDGTIIVISDWDEHTWLWDVATLKHLYTLPGELAKFTPDGNSLASIDHVDKPHLETRNRRSWGYIIRLWDLSTDISITPLPVASPPVGKRLTINLSIASGENVGGYQATIGFNPATLRYVESENGDYLPPGAFFVPPVVNRNRVTIGATSLTADGGSGDGTLATLTFEVLAVKESRLILHESLLTDPDGTYLINFTTDGQVAFPSTPAIVRITPSSVLSPAVGEHLTLTANIADGQNVADYELTWHYDDFALRYVSETRGDYIPSGGVGNGDGTLMTTTFEVIYIKDSSISLSGSLTTPNGDAFTPTFEGAEIKIPAFGDVNRDGAVNILDLVVVAVSFGQTVTEGGNPADVNEDGVVNIVDLVQVAGALGGDAAAPTAYPQALEMFTAADIQHWLIQAQDLALTDATSQKGIRFFQQLLVALTPKETALLPNYPNPFNPETWIPYQLAKPADVTVSIHTVDGKLVRTLVLGHQPVGIYQAKSRAAYWDGKNRHGEPVASGVYFYTLTAGEFTETRKMLIRK